MAMRARVGRTRANSGVGEDLNPPLAKQEAAESACALTEAF